MKLACCKQNGKCCCPRCLQEKENIWKLGQVLDMRNRRQNLRKDNEILHYNLRSVRERIFNRGLRVNSRVIDAILQDQSFAPIRVSFVSFGPETHSIPSLAPFILTLAQQSPFSELYFDLGLDVYSLFVPDIMHEFDLGVWKAILLHLLRILFVLGDLRIQEFNLRYREVPTFGKGTIRQITNNVSGLKQLAAHDYEDLLIVRELSQSVLYNPI